MAEASTLLKRGLIVDGTGQTPAFEGSVLIRGDKIIEVLPKDADLPQADLVIDCVGKVIAPGIIDAHSHHDWFMTSPNVSHYLKPFTMQGVTTFVAGNCGFGASGLKKGSKHKEFVRKNLFSAGNEEIPWDGVDEFFHYLDQHKIPSNIATYAGHGSIRQSINGGSTAPLTSAEMQELLALLGTAMDEGALGVSWGLMYEPGIFAPREELLAVAKLVAEKGKILSLHPKVMSAASPYYTFSPKEKPHNVACLEEMIELFKEAQCKVQWSHLLFCGRVAWETEKLYMETQDKAIAEGLDLCFDIYAYDCGTSVITVSFPQWLMEAMPGALDDPEMRKRYAEYSANRPKATGFTRGDIQIRKANVPHLEKYNGWFVPEIAKDMGISEDDAVLELARGPATVLQYAYINQEITDRLSVHPRCCYMTDAWMDPDGVQNPAAFGNFPKFIQRARDFHLLSMEQVIHKMSGFAAERFGLQNRGNVKTGCYADIAVLDWEHVRDNNTREKTSESPDGIEYVFVNGQCVVKEGVYQERLDAGQTIRVQIP